MIEMHKYFNWLKVFVKDIIIELTTDDVAIKLIKFRFKIFTKALTVN